MKPIKRSRNLNFFNHKSRIILVIQLLCSRSKIYTGNFKLKLKCCANTVSQIDDRASYKTPKNLNLLELYKMLEIFKDALIKNITSCPKQALNTFKKTTYILVRYPSSQIKIYQKAKKTELRNIYRIAARKITTQYMQN